MRLKSGVTAYSVGERFDRTMGSDGAILEISDSLCQCVIGLHDISEQELRAIEKGRIAVTLTQMDGIIFMCMDIDGILNFDIPFNMGLYKKFQLKKTHNGGYTMLIFLVDNETNIIKAMHAVGYDKEFSEKLYELSKKQWENRIENYDEKLNRINQTVSTEKLLENQVAFNVFGEKFLSSSMKDDKA